MVLKRHSLQSETLASSVYTGILIGLFFVFCMVSVVYVVIRSEFSRIDSVTVSGNRLIDDTVIIQVVKKLSAEQCSVMYRCGYGLWFPNTVFEHNLRIAYPRILSVHSSFDYQQNTLRIAVTERRIYAGWCTDRTVSNCYAVDQNGLLFERLPSMGGRLSFPLFIPDGQHILPLTKQQRLPLQLWTVPEFHGFTSVSDALAPFLRAGMVVYSARDMHMYMVKLYDKNIDEHSYIKLNREKLADPLYRNYVQKALDRFSSYPEFARPFYADPANLEYLDMRFMGRVYMKFRN